ncbi:NTP transferase domain-containing protein [Candidatus Woesearchaeota archaeon]|nr:NTP transferase domain-containing protein [Candidatus Woesearchaeota archaeon]
MKTVDEVVILCGGKGTRLREHTEQIPKALVEIGGKPIIWHIIKFYAHWGVNRFILCVGYKSEKIREYFSGIDDFKGKEILLSDAGENASKAKRILEASSFVKGENFYVAYGDDLSDVNIGEVAAHHIESGNIVTLTAVPLVSQFGIVELDDSLQITGFKEKPKLNHWLNGGFFVFSRRIFDYLELPGELEVEVFNELVKRGKIGAYKHSGNWKCMNTFKESQELNDLWNKNKAFWRCWKD